MTYHYPSAPRPFARTMDAARFDAIANHPAVRPWLGGAGPLELTGTLAKPDTLAGLGDAGGFICTLLSEGRYEVHSLFLPDRDPQEAVLLMRAALDYFFATSDGVTLVTKIPKDNRPALGLAKLAGFGLAWSGLVPWAPDQTREVDVFELSLDKWAARSAAALQAGTWLHDAMDDAKEAAGSALPEHSDDDVCHVQFAGAACLLILAGNAVKGVSLYNRWAQMAGYPFIHLLRLAPVIIDLGGLIVECRGEHLEVLSCR